MRKQFRPEIERGRIKTGIMAAEEGVAYGSFRLTCRTTGSQLTVIVSDGSFWQEQGMPGEAWEHVSVSARGRPPTWAEMCWVKDHFFEPEECVIQFHPPASKYVNDNPNVLHMWKLKDSAFPMPPIICV